MKNASEIMDELRRVDEEFNSLDNSGFAGLIASARIRSRRNTLRWVLQSSRGSTK